MATRKPFTLKYVKAWLIETAANNPDRLNARDGFSKVCVFRDADDNHCIAGQFLADHGLPMPSANCNITGVAKDVGLTAVATKSAIDLLGDAQSVADSGAHADDPAPSGSDYRLPWGRLPEKLQIA